MKIKMVVLLVLLAMLGTNDLVSFPKFEYTYDKNGNRTYREIVLFKQGVPIEERVSNIGKNIVKIYPNPTQGDLSIEVDGFDRDLQLKILIFDLHGEAIFSLETDNTFEKIDLKDYPNGVYFMKLFIGDKVKEWKIIKQS